MQRLLSFILCLGLAVTTLAQEQIGLRAGMYAGINGVTLNPSLPTTSPFAWDINLGAISQFAQTNYGYIEPANVGDLLNDNQYLEGWNFPTDAKLEPNQLLYDVHQSTFKKYGTLAHHTMGPSFLANFENLFIGVFTTLRGYGGSQNIPSNFNIYDYRDEILADGDFTIRAFDGAAMAWAELGLTVGTKIETATGKFGIAANIKRLQGFEAVYGVNNSATDMQLVGRGLYVFEQSDAEFGYTTSNLEDTDIELQTNGQGFGIDFGITYTVEESDYVAFSIGASILDLGKINFTNNAEFHLIQQDSSFNAIRSALSSRQSIQENVQAISNMVLGDPDASLQANEFDMLLPTAFSIQADYAVTPYIFVNALLIQRLGWQANQVKRGNLFALTPRVENRWFSASLPISIYNWRNPRVGASVRLAFLTIGSDHLGGFFGKNQLTGADIYLALKINPFEMGNLSGGGRGGKNIKCYTF